MYSTPPQYHIRGAAINLLLKVYRPEESGLQGEVNAGYLYNYRNGTQGGISLLYTTPKWNIDLLYNTHYEQNRQTTDTYSHHTLKNNVYDICQHNNIDRKGITHYVRTGAEYKFNGSAHINLAYTGIFNPNNDNHSYSDGNITTADNRTKKEAQMHNLALDYLSGFGMKAGINYTSYHSESHQQFTNKDNKKQTSEFHTTSGQIIDRWKIYVDQSHTLMAPL